MTHDVPIVAVSSAPGRSLRGMVRVSGDALGPAVGALLDPAPLPRRLSAARLRLGAEEERDHRALPVLAAYSRGPRSFTGQDVLEIQAPGNPAVLERVVHRVLEELRRTVGAGRLAEAGEFTRRAFAAGRIDLTRAEGIAATIAAVSDAQLRAAAMLRRGELGRWAEAVVDRLGQVLALVEAGIDFVDQEDVVPIGPAELDRVVSALLAELEELLRRSRSWSALEALPWVVLIGEPNVGKSTLFNALLGRERAVTSDVAGTTRDVLAEPLRLGDAEVMLVDVAGLDEATGALDRAMQAAAREAIDRAELLLLLSATADFPRSPRPDTPTLHVRTKADLAPGPGPDPGASNGTSGADPDAPLPVSALTGEGPATLRQRIAALIGDRAVTLSGQMLALQPRHRDELAAALTALRDARQLLAPQLDAPALAEMELVAESLRMALDHLAALGGRLTPDDVLGKVFATFCIGK